MSVDEDDCGWVFDSLVGFLQGPIWNAPILTFIEQKSSIFEPGSVDHEDEYRNTYEEYKNLVDSMLGSYMEDIGITGEQFEAACNQTVKSKTRIRFHKTLFEQVWAANDYEIFKRMMIQKNLELQLQALELIQQRCGMTPQSLLPSEEENLQTDEESKIMEEVIKKSLEEYQATREMLDGNSLEMERSLATADEERHRLELECKREKERMNSVIQHTIEPTAAVEEIIPAPENEMFSLNREVDEEEIRKRREYLKAQRDKLLALKKQEREKQLKAAEENAVKPRPKSARVAKSSLTGEPDLDNKTLQIRKALAERLKSEVVGHF